MADTKVSALTSLVGTGVDTAADVLPIVDTSAATTKKILVDELRIALLSNTALTNSMAVDVALNNVSTSFTGPTVAQGTTGTWFASGQVTVKDSAGAANIRVALTDGTTTINSATVTVPASAGTMVVALSGYITSPAGNIRIVCKDITSTSGVIVSNDSGSGKDSTISVVRIG